MARCVQAARAGSYRTALTNAGLTACFGVLFLASKVVEWVAQIRDGNALTTNDFFMLLLLPDRPAPVCTC